MYPTYFNATVLLIFFFSSRSYAQNRAAIARTFGGGKTANDSGGSMENSRQWQCHGNQPPPSRSSLCLAVFFGDGEPQQSPANKRHLLSLLTSFLLLEEPVVVTTQDDEGNDGVDMVVQALPPSCCIFPWKPATTIAFLSLLGSILQQRRAPTNTGEPTTSSLSSNFVSPLRRTNGSNNDKMTKVMTTSTWWCRPFPLRVASSQGSTSLPSNSLTPFPLVSLHDGGGGTQPRCPLPQTSLCVYFGIRV
ncbi:hypothetical protein PIB30_030407 [Stylosanthes scabra]|uniref:Secreted protein n=1 Tax=Stylosanthes scabra TaxID=79078 RepID=A0ABU6Z8D4_9FABA|nr:hypothetical protein [Stylosanthes scabra]